MIKIRILINEPIIIECPSAKTDSGYLRFILTTLHKYSSWHKIGKKYGIPPATVYAYANGRRVINPRHKAALMEHIHIDKKKELSTEDKKMRSIAKIVRECAKLKRLENTHNEEILINYILEKAISLRCFNKKSDMPY
jgi:hypothetical protein